MDRSFDRAWFALALILLAATGAGGPGWGDPSSAAVLAVHLEHTAASPLYDLCASVAAYLPFGEPGFRLGLLGALLGAVAVLGVIRAARALLPNDPIAGVVGAVLLLLASPFRNAAGFADSSILAAAGVVWAIAFTLDNAREPTTRKAVAALACAAVALGAAPWLGAPMIVLIGLAVRGAPRTVLAITVGALGALSIVLFAGAVGRMPDPRADLTGFVAASAPAAVLVGAGLLGAGFATATKLPNARWLAAAIVLVAAYAIFVDHRATILLSLFAVGAAVLPSAVARVVKQNRHVVAAAAGVPVIGAALLANPMFAVDDPGDAPQRLATDLLDEVPPGPGVFVATRPVAWSAIEYARLVAGARPDLALAPPLPPTSADVVVKNALVTHRVAASDVFVFGRLDPRWSFPRGRAFELLLAEPTKLAPIRPPARYRSAIGEAEATVLALELARYEGGFGRLDAAAHAAGVAKRFNAADLAVLATAQPVHPPLYGLIPDFGTPPGPWMLELIGDDLAWVAGIDQPDVDSPPARKLHTLWRKLLTGGLAANDPAIAALGPAAVKATAELLPKQ